MRHTITLADWVALNREKRKPSKYRNKPTISREGVRFASKGEARRDAELHTLQSLGRITGLKRQVKFDLVVQAVKICAYVPDWVYFEDGQPVAEDFKGHETQAFKIKIKLARALFPHVDWRVTR